MIPAHALLLLVLFPASIAAVLANPPAVASVQAGTADRARPTAPATAGAVRDVAYGPHPRQRFDVYLPAAAVKAPVIVLVHGGGWAFGDKASRAFVEAKVAYWTARGYALVSTNYPLVPEATPLEQARHVARALARAQELAPLWGADRTRFLLMGHSAGAHLVALLGASPGLLDAAGASRPLGVVALDTAALDVVSVMQAPRLPRLYVDAFGSDPVQWAAASPHHLLAADSLPMLLVCSSVRPQPCPTARAFAVKAKAVGVPMQVLPQDLSHMEINRELGRLPAYTAAVDAYIRALEADHPGAGFGDVRQALCSAARYSAPCISIRREAARSKAPPRRVPV